jgi:hypothetical protein
MELMFKVFPQIYTIPSTSRIGFIDFICASLGSLQYYYYLVLVLYLKAAASSQAEEQPDFVPINTSMASDRIDVHHHFVPDCYRQGMNTLSTTF